MEKKQKNNQNNKNTSNHNSPSQPSTTSTNNNNNANILIANNASTNTPSTTTTTNTNTTNFQANNSKLDSTQLNPLLLHAHTQHFQLFSCLTWGHNDQRLFVACSNTLHVLRVHKEIPTFSLLSQMAIKQRLNNVTQLSDFCLSERLKEQLKYCFASSVKTLYPRVASLRQFVCACLPKNERLHCTLKCLSNIKSSHDYYTLYLEYLGGLIPLLSARKSSKLKPDFVIYDPYLTRKKKVNKRRKQEESKKMKQIKEEVKTKKLVNNTDNDTKPVTSRFKQISQHLLEKDEEINDGNFKLIV